MKYLLHYVPNGEHFFVTEGEKLYVKTQGQGSVEIQAVVEGPAERPKGYLQPGSISYAPVKKCENPNGYIDVPTGQLLTTQTCGQTYTFVESRDSECREEKIVPPKPYYDVWGTCQVRGDTYFVSPPFGLAAIKGRVTLQVQDAWQCKSPYGYGLLYLETSDDLQLWEPLEGFGFPGGMVTISQKDIEPGNIYGEEIQVLSGGRHGRIRFDPACTLGPAFNATLTIEISK